MKIRDNNPSVFSTFRLFLFFQVYLDLFWYYLILTLLFSTVHAIYFRCSESFLDTISLPNVKLTSCRTNVLTQIVSTLPSLPPTLPPIFAKTNPPQTLLNKYPFTECGGKGGGGGGGGVWEGVVLRDSYLSD